MHSPFHTHTHPPEDMANTSQATVRTPINHLSQNPSILHILIIIKLELVNVYNINRLVK